MQVDYRRRAQRGRQGRRRGLEPIADEEQRVGPPPGQSSSYRLEGARCLHRRGHVAFLEPLEVLVYRKAVGLELLHRHAERGALVHAPRP